MSDKSFEMHSIRKTIIVCEGASLEDIGLRYRKDGELVHLRDTEQQRCKSCGAFGAMVWTDSESTHRLHKDKCKRKTLALA